MEAALASTNIAGLAATGLSQPPRRSPNYCWPKGSPVATVVPIADVVATTRAAAFEKVMVLAEVGPQSQRYSPDSSAHIPTQ